VFTGEAMSDLGDAGTRRTRDKTMITVRNFQVHFHIKINDLTFELVVRCRVVLKQTRNTDNVEEGKEGNEQDGAEEAKVAKEEPAPPVPERPPSAAGSHDLSFSNNGRGRICNQNVGNVVNTTIILSEFTRRSRPLPVIS